LLLCACAAIALATSPAVAGVLARDQGLPQVTRSSGGSRSNPPNAPASNSGVPSRGASSPATPGASPPSSPQQNGIVVDQGTFDIAVSPANHGSESVAPVVGAASGAGV